MLKPRTIPGGTCAGAGSQDIAHRFGRSRDTAQLPHMRFRAIERALPSKLVTNNEMIELVLASSETVLPKGELPILATRIRALFQTCKTDVRYHRSPGETALDLGLRAGRQALERARMDCGDIDLLLYVGVGRGFIEPATATVFQSSLGLVNATAFDILDACASWLRALQIAYTFINAGTYRNVMILNSECNREYGNLCFKSLDDLSFRFPALTIGEAATATVITGSPGMTDSYFSFRTWGAEHTLCKIPLPHYREFSLGERLDPMAPLEFFSFGELLFRSACEKLIEHFRQDPVLSAFRSDHVFGHAASDRLTERVARQLGLTAPYLTHARFGNTVSASIPLGMSEARREGGLSVGDSVLLGCGSAGVTTGWACFRYEE